MSTMNKLAPVLAVLATMTLSACETMNGPLQAQSASQPVYADRAYSGAGVVQSIELVRESSGIGGSGVGVGAIAGAVIGGILGNQVGGGTGQAVATVAGAAGGAYAGHQLEKQNQAQDAYRFSIRMDGGSYQTVTQSSNPDIRVGDRVRIDNGVVYRY
jgi:outer membrane lipoprotein SlyB